MLPIYGLCTLAVPCTLPPRPPLSPWSMRSVCDIKNSEHCVDFRYEGVMSIAHPLLVRSQQRTYIVSPSVAAGICVPESFALAIPRACGSPGS